MDYLWTPWRYQYVTKAGKEDGCIFCATVADTGHDRERLVVACEPVLEAVELAQGIAAGVERQGKDGIGADLRVVGTE